MSSITEFLTRAATRLQDQPHIYAALDNILTSNGRSPLEVRTEVQQLLRDHRLLITAFNGLLPPEFTSDLHRAFDLFIRMEERLRHEHEGLYQSFLRLMEMVRLGHKPRREVAREVLDLLTGHPDLHDEFLDILPFLPPGPNARLQTSTMSPGTAEFLRLARIRLRDQTGKNAALADILDGRRPEEVRTEVAELLRDQPLLIVAFNGLLPPAFRIPSPSGPSDLHRAFDFISRVKQRSRIRRASTSRSFISWKRSFGGIGHVVRSQVKSWIFSGVIKTCRMLLCLFCLDDERVSTPTPQQCRPHSSGSPGSIPSSHFQGFILRVEERFRHEDKRYAYLWLLDMCEVHFQGESSSIEFEQEVMDLLHDHIDLQQEFLALVRADVL